MFELFELSTFRKVMKKLTPPIEKNDINLWAAQASSSLDDSINVKFILIEGKEGTPCANTLHRLVMVSKAGEDCEPGYVDKEELIFADGLVLVGNAIMQDAHMLLGELFRIMEIGNIRKENSPLMKTLKTIEYENPLEIFDNSLTTDFPEEYVPPALHL